MHHPPAPRSRNLGVLALAVIAPLWGYSWVVTKVALGYSGPFTFAGLISGLGAICLFTVLAVRRRPLQPPPLGWTLLIGLLQTALFNGLATAALAVGGAGKVSVLVCTMPFWLLLLAWPFSASGCAGRSGRPSRSRSPASSWSSARGTSEGRSAVCSPAPPASPGPARRCW